MQAYPGRNPVMDVLSGKLSFRQFRLMVEHLPPGNVWERKASDGWSDVEWLSWHTEGRLRELITLLANAYRPKGTPALDVPGYLATPGGGDRDPEAAATQAAYDNAMQAELEGLW